MQSIVQLIETGIRKQYELYGRYPESIALTSREYKQMYREMLGHDPKVLPFPGLHTELKVMGISIEINNRLKRPENGQ